MKIHENIKKLREQAGLSQSRLAEMVGYKDRSSIAKVEAGEVDLSQSKIAAFAKALNVSPAFLMVWEYEENKQPKEEPETVRDIAAHALHKLSEEDAEKVLEFAQYLLSKEKD